VRDAISGVRTLPRRSLSANKSRRYKCVCHIVLREGGPDLSYNLIKPQKTCGALCRAWRGPARPLPTSYLLGSKMHNAPQLSFLRSESNRKFCASRHNSSKPLFYNILHTTDSAAAVAV
jgi:hypothetical protein